MKIFNTILFISAFLLMFIQTNAVQKTISIKNFGAVGNGVHDDHEAFTKAANYINNAKKNITLVIPYGTYLVGKQTPSSKYYLEGEPVLSLINVQNIVIRGVFKNGKRPIIKFKNNMLFGTFYTSGKNQGKPKCTPELNNYDLKSAATMGVGIGVTNSQNIIISNLELYGNQDGMQIGGYYGDKGRQLDHRGLYLISSRNIEINNLNIHHFGLDGIEISNSNNTKINISKIEYNGRQAVSWVSGDSLIMNNCKLNYSGCSRINSAPCAGIDIECEGSKRIQYGRFNNCEFNYNRGCGILSDKNKFVPNNMIFNKCSIVGLYNWAVWFMATKTEFNDCNIYGQCTHVVQSSDVLERSDITTFNNCFFTNVYKNQFTFKKSPFLIEINNGRIRMFKCKIQSQNIGLLYHSGSCNNTILPSEIRDCSFICDNLENSHIATECISVTNSSFFWVEKVSTNLNMIKNENNKINSLSRNEILKLFTPFERGTIPFTDRITNYICHE